MMFQKKELRENDGTEESPDTIKQEVVRLFLLFIYLNSCHLLMIFAKCLDPDQAQQNVGLDLNPKLFNP